MTRWRDLAGPVGLFPTGARNAITDVPGVLVGHAQAGSGEATGVSVVVPPRLPARAGVNTVNGVGELTKKLEIDEWGIIQSPVWLCGTHAVGTVYHGAVLAAGGDPDNTVIPVVGECDDSDMGDSRTVTVDDVNAALANAGVDVAEGTVGGGTVGVLLMCNFGDRERFTSGGLRFEPAEPPEPPEGSCIAVCATDAPLEAQQLRRLSLRPLLGLARAGSYASNGSGEIGVAFTVAEDEGFPLGRLSPLFAAAYEAAEEAVYNCLVAARPGRRRNGKMQDEFPVHLVRRGA
jgi:D-aminopeptidase